MFLYNNARLWVYEGGGEPLETYGMGSPAEKVCREKLMNVSGCTRAKRIEVITVHALVIAQISLTAQRQVIDHQSVRQLFYKQTLCRGARGFISSGVNLCLQFELT